MKSPWPLLVGLLPLVSVGQISTPDIGRFALTNGRPVLEFTPVPSATEYRVRHSPGLGIAGDVVPGLIGGAVWGGSNVVEGSTGWYRVEASQLPPDVLSIGTLLGRIAYGATPDELDRVRRIGAQAYIDEQLAPENIAEDLDEPPATGPVWRKVTMTGTGSASRLYIYLNGAGDAYLDDIRLVQGASDDGTGPNLIANGGFESPLDSSNWVLTPNTADSARTADYVRSGDVAFHLVMNAAGTTSTDSVVQTIVPSLSSRQIYTLSFWYLTTSADNTLTVRLSGDGIVATAADTESAARYFARLQAGTANIADLRAWHVLRAARSQKQLAEVFRQFLENHFVTEYSKSQDYFDGRGGLPSELAGPVAVRQEFKENMRWRAAFENPRCTFHELLKISAESPAMIIYLDTVLSRGDFSNSARTNRIANENYAREICELFAFGVDNGYDQGDIVQISRAWTGWTVELLDTNQVSNPFASRSTHYINPGLTNASQLNSVTNLIGEWSFRYRADRHDPRIKWAFYAKAADGSILTNSPKRIPARFGPPWAGRTYGLRLANGATTNGIRDGYEILAHMADQPFTQEYISVKLCRLLVHDNFHHGYDFSDGVSTPEEDLVKACMLAWESPAGGGPKGQIRQVLRVILNSALFESHLTASAKVKTPLEFAVSTIRAFRARRDDGSFTSTIDAANIVGTDGILNRAGRMRLFDRAEPDGYPEDGAGWISAGTLSDRLRFVQSLALAGAGLPTTPAPRSQADQVGLSRIDPSGLIALKVGAGVRSAEAVVDYFLDLLFPGEGRANLTVYRSVGVDFLNTSDNGVTVSPFETLVPGSRDYDGRIRGLVALLMATPRFQEQ
jgi:uncharacterized protein (DUF1800 family)